MRSVKMTIVQGTPFRFVVDVKYRDDTNALVPLPIDDCFIHLQARKFVNSESVLLDLDSSGNGIVIDDTIVGRFTIAMEKEETSALVWGVPHVSVEAVFQCEVDPPDGDTFRALDGTLTLDPEVVR